MSGDYTRYCVSKLQNKKNKGWSKSQFNQERIRYRARVAKKGWIDKQRENPILCWAFVRMIGLLASQGPSFRLANFESGCQRNMDSVATVLYSSSPCTKV